MMKRACAWLSVVGVAAIAVLSIGNGSARAEWPDRTITIVAHFAPGGSNDLLARLIASELGPALKQNVIVENRPGANGNIGLTYAAHAAAGRLHFGCRLRRGARSIRAFASLAMTDKGFCSGRVSRRFAQRHLDAPRIGHRVDQDLIDKAKAEPGQDHYSSPGVGSISQLAVELLELRTNTKLIHVPVPGRGAGRAGGDGRHDRSSRSVNVAGLIGFIQSGKLKALVQTGEKRWPDLPDVPTMQQAGIPDAVVETTQMLLAPAGTPRADHRSTRQRSRKRSWPSPTCARAC